MTKLALLSLIGLACWCSAVSAAEVKSAKPNILLILADDMGYGDSGCYGGKLAPTPAIDSLAREGVRCTDGYVTAPVCAPSRCGIMTGAYNQRFGIQWNEDRAKYNVGPHKLLPQALKSAGYVTGHIGKWNVGADITGCFDETYDVIDWEADYFPDQTGHYVGLDSPSEHASSKVQGVWGPKRASDEYLTDRIGRHAVEFIEKHQAQPFFLYLAFNAVHSPWSAKTAARERFAHLKDPPLNFYAAMIASLDENIACVLAKLKAAGLEQNTLVVFTSDNGPAMGSPNIKVWPENWPKKILVGSAGPLRGYKAQFFEGGIREPFIVRWPATLKAGDTYRQPVSTMDLYATFCAAAGAPVPAGTKLDGVNLLPYLSGEKAGVPHEILFWKNGDQGAVRQGDWKLVISALQPKLQLFNLAADIGEQNDLSGEQPKWVEKLHRAWLDWSTPLPPRANPQSAQAGKGKAATAGAKLPQDRAALFDQKDQNHDGKLSLDEFLANQTDPETAKKRFAQWDTDQDGFLSRAEFINMGGKSK
ncbi:MAG: sulfatase-like hydrolase/transferase [Verrucomicrobiota bacterium]